MTDLNLVIHTHAPYRLVDVEMCEHKGIGHPDSLCDGIAEAVSLALNAAYLHSYGRVMHYNVDKALLIGGSSEPQFGGGNMKVPMRLIVCGRATSLPDMEIANLVKATAHQYLEQHLHCDVNLFQIESAVRTGSPNLQQVFSRSTSIALANDTSFGVGFAPYSLLEGYVLQLASILKSKAFRTTFPAAGDDYKVMGSRIGTSMNFTIALAIVDRHIQSVEDYFSVKQQMVSYLHKQIPLSCEVVMNTLDNPDAKTAGDLYLTVTGLSSEHGDDGQVGRGNRMNGLITPCRSMSLEAVAGKNPVAHVGKLYNALSWEIAKEIVGAVSSIEDVTVQLLSCIGRPVNQPALVVVDLGISTTMIREQHDQVERIVQRSLNNIQSTSLNLINGEIPAF